MSRSTEFPGIDAAISKSVNFELSIADLALRSERRAWRVAFCSTAMSLVLVAGYFYVLPLKEKVPYLVLADAYTGTSSLARLSKDVIDRRLSSSEAINRSNIAHFVLARESYDLSLTNLRDWPTVLTMAAPSVALPYRELHAASNPDSPYATYGKSRAIRIKILSIVLIGAQGGKAPKGATVRFQRSIYDKSTGRTAALDGKIATMEFTYNPNLRMDDHSRIENPLGFQVLNYRVDNDYDSTIPVEFAGDAQDAPAAASPPRGPGATVSAKTGGAADGGSRR